MNPCDLPTRWRALAADLRRFGGDHHAVALESAAEELTTALRQYELEALTLDAAAHESGFSYSAINRQVRSGKIPNAGSKGSPRVRRCDLPRCGGRQRPRLVEGSPDLAGEILQARHHRGA